MELQFFCPRWGSEHLEWTQFLQKVKDAGFDGIEYAIAADVPTGELDTVWEAATKLNLLIIPQHYDTYEPHFEKHVRRYEEWLQKLAPYPAPKIDSQTGKDFFSFEQNKTLIEIATAHTARTGVPVYHETHRNKFPFAAHITREYLERVPGLQLTLDISHWVAVAESYLADQPEAVALAIQRTGHLHARVGYPEGPQVPDPRAPAWREALDVHLGWWDRVVEAKKSSGEAVTITPEFGPHPYMVHHPLSGEPIASQWDINVFMLQMLKQRYAA